MMMEWERNQNRAYLVALKGDGYEFEITSDGYFVSLNGKGLGGAGVRAIDRTKKRHWKHQEADRKEYLKHAVNFALNHKEKSAKAEI